MKRMNLFVALTLFVFASGPAVAFADHHEPGAKAAEKRSEKGAEKSNAQWSDDAVKGAGHKPATGAAAEKAAADKAKAAKAKTDVDVQDAAKKAKAKTDVDAN